MQVKLRVTQGSSAGKEVPVPRGKFLVGRADDCHLRPKSEAISRRHCMLLVGEDTVLVEDLRSRNGTYVNGQRIEGQKVLSGGEILRFGPLEFEVLVVKTPANGKRPAVTGVKDVAARPAADAGDEDITQWLEGDEEETTADRVAEPETRQYRLDDTNRVNLESLKQGETSEAPAAPQEVEATGKSKAPHEKPKTGKLPLRPQTASVDSREAAADMLKRFFNRR